MLVFWIVTPFRLVRHFGPEDGGNVFLKKRWCLPTSPHGVTTQKINTDEFGFVEPQDSAIRMFVIYITWYVDKIFYLHVMRSPFEFYVTVRFSTHLSCVINSRYKYDISFLLAQYDIYWNIPAGGVASEITGTRAAATCKYFPCYQVSYVYVKLLLQNG
jgi:hypothetical protein